MALTKRGFGMPLTAAAPGYVVLVASMVGAAAAALTVTPVATLSAKDNFFSSCTFTSTGLYVVTLKELPGTVIDIIPTLYRAAGTTLLAAVRSWDTAAKTVTIDVRDGASSLGVANATTGDTIRLLVICKNSNA